MTSPRDTYVRAALEAEVSSLRNTSSGRACSAFRAAAAVGVSSAPALSPTKRLRTLSSAQRWTRACPNVRPADTSGAAYITVRRRHESCQKASHGVSLPAHPPSPHSRLIHLPEGLPRKRSTRCGLRRSLSAPTPRWRGGFATVTSSYPSASASSSGISPGRCQATQNSTAGPGLGAGFGTRRGIGSSFGCGTTWARPSPSARAASIPV